MIAAFGATGTPARLPGGEGRAWRVGEAVFKPCAEPEQWSWLAEQLPAVREDGFRLARALRAADGRWVVAGWCAQRALVGRHPAEARWLDVLSVCERFHAAVRDLPQPPFLAAKSDPWAVGDRVAWGEAAPPDHAPILRLVRATRDVALPSQLVHGDVTENVLFAEGHAPALIDVSPYWRPAGFASAVVVADALCWRDADPRELLAAVAHLEEFPQLFLRALIYRMTTTAVVGRRIAADLEGYRATADLALQLARG